MNLPGLDTIQALALSVHVFLEFPHDKAGSFHIDVADRQEGMILAEDITSAKVRHPVEAREPPQRDDAGARQGLVREPSSLGPPLKFSLQGPIRQAEGRAVLARMTNHAHWRDDEKLDAKPMAASGQ